MMCCRFVFPFAKIIFTCKMRSALSLTCRRRKEDKKKQEQGHFSFHIVSRQSQQEASQELQQKPKFLNSESSDVVQKRHTVF